MRKKHKIKYPPYPDSAWDYGCKMSAAQQLVKPNKVICIYCWGQAPVEVDIVHTDDCPARNDTKVK